MFGIYCKLARQPATTQVNKMAKEEQEGLEPILDRLPHRHTPLHDVLGPVPSWFPDLAKKAIEASRPRDGEKGSPLPKMEQPEYKDMEGDFAKATPQLIWFFNALSKKLRRCKLYYTFPEMTRGGFKVEVLAIASVDGKRYSAVMRTPLISTGAGGGKVLVEVNTIAEGLQKILGVRIFSGKAVQLKREALPIFVEPA